MSTPEYILSLREKIGHDLLWLPGATAVVLHEGRILLGRRSDNGNWAPITGIVDPGEEPAATAVPSSGRVETRRSRGTSPELTEDTEETERPRRASSSLLIFDSSSEL